MATETRRPSGAGDAAEMTPSGDATNWECVDEEVSDDDTTYNGSPFTGSPRSDLLALPATAIPAGSLINSVTVYARAKELLDEVQVAVQCRLGGTTVVGTLQNLTTSYATYSEALARPGGGLWQQTDMNSLQIGYTDDARASGGFRCTQCWVVVDYTAPSAARVSGAFAIG